MDHRPCSSLQSLIQYLWTEPVLTENLESLHFVFETRSWIMKSHVTDREWISSGLHRLIGWMSWHWPVAGHPHTWTTTTTTTTKNRPTCLRRSFAGITLDPHHFRAWSSEAGDQRIVTGRQVYRDLKSEIPFTTRLSRFILLVVVDIIEANNRRELKIPIRSWGSWSGGGSGDSNHPSWWAFQSGSFKHTSFSIYHHLVQHRQEDCKTVKLRSHPFRILYTPLDWFPVSSSVTPPHILL